MDAKRARLTQYEVVSPSTALASGASALQCFVAQVTDVEGSTAALTASELGVKATLIPARSAAAPAQSG